MMNKTQLAAYGAAHTSAAFTEMTHDGWLRLTGRDRLDLLHRLWTNDLNKLAPGTGAPTVLTSATGRVMAVLMVYADDQDVYVRTMPGQATGVSRYLSSMIFWQDQVEVSDLSSHTSHFALYGPDSTRLLGQLADTDLQAIPPSGWRALTIGDAPVTVHRGGMLEPADWMAAVGLDARQFVLSALSALAPALDDETAELLRIEAGLPLWGRELNDQVTPLETGLLAAISFNKGCYTGQEVIARQTNYDKVTRNLVGLEFAPGLDLTRNDTRGGAWGEVRGPGRGGFVGSVAHSPTLDRVIGLAVVPRELVQPGALITVVREGVEHPATVHSLPFIQRSY